MKSVALRAGASPSWLLHRRRPGPGARSAKPGRKTNKKPPLVDGDSPKDGDDMTIEREVIPQISLEPMKFETSNLLLNAEIPISFLDQSPRRNAPP